jgi:peptide/nickel transport system substrate-binding protein
MRRKQVSKISRREFIHISALAAAGVTLAACAKATGPTATTAPKAGEATATPAPKAAEATATPKPAAQPAGLEAPGAAEQVAAGTLPPLDERLPQTPFVVGQGIEVWSDDLQFEVGTYDGGVLRTVTTQPQWSYPCQHALQWILSCPKHHTGPLRGNIVESFEYNADMTEYTFQMRKGLKWSDGEPVTTDDIKFAWEDCLLNDQITTAVDQTLRDGADPGGDPLTLEILDQFSYKCTFKKANARFLKTMGMANLWDPYNQVLRPKHYLEQFLPAYASADQLKALLDKQGLNADQWPQLFTSMGGTWWGGGCENESIGLPVLRGWNVVEHPNELIIMERNPYYFKVDEEGKQLPYVSRIEGAVVAKPENIPPKIVSGDINFCREIITHTDVALYKEHEGTSYVVNLDMVYHNAPMALMLNYNNPDENWQKVVLDVRFRQAVNAAMDFQAIIDTLYLGMGKPCPWYPPGGDPAKANQLLDEMGLDQKDSEGWRIGPDGKRFEIVWEQYNDPLAVQPAQLVAAQLQAVGLYVDLKMIDYTLFNERRDANELYAAMDWSDDCNWPFIMYYDLLPNSRIQWGQLWHRWMVTGGNEGVEPPDWIKDLYDINAQLAATDPNGTAAPDLLQRFADWEMKWIPIFPIARDVHDPCIVPPNLRNVPTSGRSSAMMFSEEQVWFKV